MIALLLVAAISIPGGHGFVGRVVQVHDGDTLRLDSGVRVRLQGIDSNELDGSCHGVCAPLSAQQARDNLARLVLGKRITCVSTGRSYQRVTAWCSRPRAFWKGMDLSCAQIRAGAAVRWPKFDREGKLVGCER